MEFDTLIIGGKIVDGTGNPWFYADIGIKNGKIVAMGKLRNAEAEQIITAEGLIVCPGFIDIHSHSDYTLLVNPKAESKIRQGVTTEIVGNCGSSAAPLIGEMKERAVEIAELYGLKVDWTYVDEYLKKLEENGVALNVATLVGFANIRIAVLGYENREPTKYELEEMKALVARSIDEGAVGLSTGLRYDPQSYAKTEEVIEIAKVVAEKGGIYTSHIRDEGDRGRLIEAIKEAIEIGEKAGISVEISHIKILAKPLWGKCDEMLQLIENARARGVEVTADQYPYEASGTSLLAWIPKWAFEGGRDKLLERLLNPETRAKIKEELARVMELRGGPERALISRFEADPTLEGLTVKQVAEKWKIPPDEAAIKLVEIATKEKSSLGIINFNQSEENIVKIMKKPWVMVATDGYALAPYGSLARGVPHPRSYGTYPRVLGVYVRQMKVLRLEEAIRKMTSLPARKVGFMDRGILRPGFWADIVIFDPDKIIDKATYLEPKQYPEGIKFVLVNGELVIEEGEHTGKLPGKVLRKS
ncbi:MAG: D-aminoacylase [Candidatus Methanomethylicota archaeon]|uniref:D-aminoacylase n=1 Tax=Thermoproteota archaeon TaxID=2056631 RepID=A0A497EXB2_9CREN|nr:MAG: D-aminoacylase [Candidatus Verstraetearchaeota archaeon]RLE53945.1 MAG: D-aminoacylase [Candidatus Verstraetearchaeota archaeon]